MSPAPPELAIFRMLATLFKDACNSGDAKIEALAVDRLLATGVGSGSCIRSPSNRFWWMSNEGR